MCRIVVIPVGLGMRSREGTVPGPCVINHLQKAEIIR